ncbi:MAG: threonylcarbamoyl-AMP synthase [bacterium]|nr:threonylcarbamoyl-AMP synthase [bacterium]MBK8127495.1 threonylcarbamoyl-AMP synthase [bacterium]
MIYECHPANPNARAIQKAIEALERGELIAYATDTVYGLGCDVQSKSAMERALQLKGYSKYHALSFLCADLSDISNYAKIETPVYKMMKRCIPGPFTFILPATRQVPKLLLTKQKTVGVRVPAHPVCRDLLKAFGRPILSTSVTDRDGDPMLDPNEIVHHWGEAIAVILDSGVLKSDTSTIVDCTDPDNPVVLREGRGDVSLIY